jgi:hypothetical protein
VTRVDAWPLVFIGRSRPRRHHGHRCKRVMRGVGPMTLVKFKTDGRYHWVLDRMLVKAEDY